MKFYWGIPVDALEVIHFWSKENREFLEFLTGVHFFAKNFPHQKMKVFTSCPQESVGGVVYVSTRVCPVTDFCETELILVCVSGVLVYETIRESVLVYFGNWNARFAYYMLIILG